MTVFLQGLRNRLAPVGVHVLTVKPGFVDTPMTEHIDKNPLFASAEAVGLRVHRAICRGEDVVYTPWFWAPIAWIIQCIPRVVFKRLNF